MTWLSALVVCADYEAAVFNGWRMDWEISDAGRPSTCIFAL